MTNLSKAANVIGLAQASSPGLLSSSVTSVQQSHSVVEDRDLTKNNDPPSLLPQVVKRVHIEAKDLTTAGAGNYRFCVTLAGPVDLATLGLDDVMVTGPNRYCQLAIFEGIQGCTVRYWVAAPGWGWTQADNGTYCISWADESTVSRLTQDFQVAIKPGAGLVQNGGFSAGLVNWETLAGTETVLTAEAHGGQATLVLSSADSGIRQTVWVTPGVVYRLTGSGRYLAQESIPQAYSSLGMTFFDARGRLLTRADVGPMRSAVWGAYSAIEIAPTHATYAHVWVYQSSDHGLTYIDTLAMEPIDTWPPRQGCPFVLNNDPGGETVFANGYKNA